MSSHNEQVEPTPFDAAQPVSVQQPAADTRSRQGAPHWVLPAMGALLLLAVLVIFWLPAQVSSPPAQYTGVGQDGSAPAPAPTTDSPRPGAAETDISPWSEAQLARLRKEAQDVLAELLEVQFAVEEHGVTQWAPERFAAAAALAAAGDELYRTREYVQARSRYEEALSQLQALQEDIPAEMARQLQLAETAIEQGELAPATAALDLAALIEPDSPDLTGLQQRLASLPQLLELLNEAAAAERDGDLAGAEQLLKQGAALDPYHLRTAVELQRVTAAYLQQRFNEAMSAGYAALDGGRFAKARKAFRSAAQLQTGSSEAASALQEVDTAASAYRLATLKTTGSRHEQQEQWQQAVAAYEQAIEIDNMVLFAREGLARSSARARLDKQFRTAIDEPQRLSDVAVAKATEKLLLQARRIDSAGPVLREQISRLQVLLKQYNTPVAVTLRSDQATEVIVYKVARLGRFDQRELTLRPGTYTAVGSRNGYRDVRRSFTVDHDKTPTPITIACTEPI